MLPDGQQEARPGAQASQGASSALHQMLQENLLHVITLYRPKLPLAPSDRHQTLCNLTEQTDILGKVTWKYCPGTG